MAIITKFADFPKVIFAIRTNLLFRKRSLPIYCSSNALVDSWWMTEKHLV
jgi:hypothetical protein